jgi:hypothetical protein
MSASNPGWFLKITYEYRTAKETTSAHGASAHKAYLSTAKSLYSAGASYDLRHGSQMDQELQAIWRSPGVVDLVQTSALVSSMNLITPPTSAMPLKHPGQILHIILDRKTQRSIHKHTISNFTFPSRFPSTHQVG